MYITKSDKNKLIRELDKENFDVIDELREKYPNHQIEIYSMVKSWLLK